MEHWRLPGPYRKITYLFLDEVGSLREDDDHAFDQLGDLRDVKRST